MPHFCNCQSVRRFMFAWKPRGKIYYNHRWTLIYLQQPKYKPQPIHKYNGKCTTTTTDINWTGGNQCPVRSVPTLNHFASQTNQIDPANGKYSQKFRFAKSQKPISVARNGGEKSWRTGTRIRDEEKNMQWHRMVEWLPPPKAKIARYTGLKAAVREWFPLTWFVDQRESRPLGQDGYDCHRPNCLTPTYWLTEWLSNQTDTKKDSQKDRQTVI